MKEKKGSFSGTALQIVLSAFIILFFVGVILIYYAMLYGETRERMILRGELSAFTAAEQIDSYLSTGTDTLRLVCYGLDNMIRDGRSQAEILDFLETQSVAVTNVASDYTNGIYGYINGEFMDGGSGWIPEEDYDSTQRPWYVDARAHIGRVAVVDPYLDSMTGTIMITLSKTLCDARSVAAMDSSLDHLQTITEELAARGESDMEVVLDRKYQVIAHSDKGEVGKSYLTEEGGFGSAMVARLRSVDQRYFSLRYGGAEYIVYTVPVANDWLCISVFDATSIFGQLRATLIYTIVASLLFVAILLAIMIHSGRKTLIARQLTENLSQVKSDLRERENRIGQISAVAFRDALTGVGSKAAFNRLSEELAGELARGTAELSVVMMDVNNLKYVNDSFGHEAGDSYLRGCCKLICDIYKHSPVFRMGGDEFVAVLQHDDYARRAALLAELETVFAEAYAREDKPAWERCSVSAGMSDAERGDKTLGQVLKRADTAMYAAKQAFKAKHGSYR